MKSREHELRPLIFIGTTKEGLDLGEALQQSLQHHFQVRLWPEDVFQPSSHPLTDLLNLRTKVDYAAFVLTADDVRRSRHKQSPVPRDNLIFELGLFMGALGADRVFAIAPQGDRPDLPSDLLGVTTLDYLVPERLGWQSAMGPIATKLKRLLAERPPVYASSNLVKTAAEADGGSPCDPSEPESGPRQIAVCSIEATFDGHVPLREINSIVSCLEDALKSGLISAKRTAEEPIPTTDTFDIPFRRDLTTFSEPALVSRHGATATVVWELPLGWEQKKVEMGVVLLILDFVSFLQERFRNNLCKAGVAFRPYSRKTNLRVALSAGKALRRSSEFSRGADYVGTVLEEVNDLRNSAVPGGLIAHMRLAPYLFMERLCADEGRAECKAVGVSGEPCPVWITDRPLRRRQPKQEPLHSLSAVLEWSRGPYVEADETSSAPPSFSMDDLTSIFEIREAWESKFAADLSARIGGDDEVIRLADNSEGDELLRLIEDTINQMQVLYDTRSNVAEDPEWRQCGVKFHSQIAEFSHPDERIERKRFTEWVYGFTKAVYLRGMIDAGRPTKTDEKLVIEEHRHIVKLIRKGRTEQVRGLIKKHLVSHYDRAHDAFLSCDTREA